MNVDQHLKVATWHIEQARLHATVILRLLAAEPGRVYSRDEILDQVWGMEAFPTNRTIDNYIVKLRQKIEPDLKEPRHLVSIYGKGYKLAIR